MPYNVYYDLELKVIAVTKLLRQLRDQDGDVLKVLQEGAYLMNLN
jgi:hypothetical protein